MLVLKVYKSYKILRSEATRERGDVPRSPRRGRSPPDLSQVPLPINGPQFVVPPTYILPGTVRYFMDGHTGHMYIRIVLFCSFSIFSSFFFFLCCALVPGTFVLCYKNYPGLGNWSIFYPGS